MKINNSPVRFGARGFAVEKIIAKTIKENPGKAANIGQDALKEFGSNITKETFTELNAIRHIANAGGNFIEGNKKECVVNTAQAASTPLKIVAGTKGAEIGAGIGAMTGPLAPVAVPVCSVVGYFAGSFIVDKMVSKSAKSIAEEIF